MLRIRGGIIKELICEKYVIGMSFVGCFSLMLGIFDMVNTGSMCDQPGKTTIVHAFGKI